MRFTLSSGARGRFTVPGATLVAMLLLAAPAAASDVSVSFSSLEIDGDNDADVISLSRAGDTLTIRDTGVGGVTTSDGDCTQVNGTTVTCPVDPPGNDIAAGFFVDLGNGNDSFVNQNFEPSFGQIFAFGATGTKTISGGPGPQFVGGGIDNDTLDGGPGDDNLQDGSGNDLATPTGGNDVLIGGPGEDSTGYFRDLNTPLSITLDGLANDGQAGEADNVQVENVSAGNGNDVLVGDELANRLDGGGGSDLIIGLGGNDELAGDFGSGAFVNRRGIIGAGGDDTLDGGQGRDSLDCGPGFDLALREPADSVANNCERIGAEVVGDSAKVGGKKKKKRFKAQILCPASELEACSGKLVVTSAGKKIGKGKFSVAAGETKGQKAKLKKKGRKALRKAGGALLVTVEARTNEPGGVATHEGRILIHD